MIKKSYLLGLMICTISVLVAQTPMWVKEEPINPLFYIGVGSSSVAQNNYKDIAKERALQEVANQIQVQISSNSSSSMRDDNGNLSENYSEQVRITNSTKLKGYEIVDSYQDSTRYYVYFRLSKERFSEEMEREYVGGIEQTQKLIDEAEEMAMKGDAKGSIETLLRASLFIEELIDNSFIKKYQNQAKGQWETIKLQLVQIMSSIKPHPVEQIIQVSKQNLIGVHINAFAKYNNKHLVGYMPMKYKMRNQPNAFKDIKSTTNISGRVVNSIARVYTDHRAYQVDISVDYISYLSSLSNKGKMWNIINNETISSSQTITVNIEAPQVLLKTEETIFGEKRQNQGIYSAIRNYLEQKHIQIHSGNSDTVTSVSVEANYQKGSVYQGFYSVLLNVRVVVLKNGITIKVIDCESVKGVGSNYQDAMMKATKKFQNNIGELLGYNFLSYM